MAIMIQSLFLVRKRNKEKRKSREEKKAAAVGRVDVPRPPVQEQLKEQYEKNMGNMFCHVVHARSVVSHDIVVV